MSSILSIKGDGYISSKLQDIVAPKPSVDEKTNVYNPNFTIKSNNPNQHILASSHRNSLTSTLTQSVQVSQNGLDNQKSELDASLSSSSHRLWPNTSLIPSNAAIIAPKVDFSEVANQLNAFNALKNAQFTSSSDVDTKESDDTVVIHVYDETRQINKDFNCKRKLLVANMKYFESFLSENENGYDDIDISVHCDVEIFEWLMSYIQSINVKTPILDKSVVISILISSDFLQMDKLVDQCLEFIVSCLSDIIKLPIDLSCISEKLVNKLALLTSPKVCIQLYLSNM